MTSRAPGIREDTLQRLSNVIDRSPTHLKDDGRRRDPAQRLVDVDFLAGDRLATAFVAEVDIR